MICCGKRGFLGGCGVRVRWRLFGFTRLGGHPPRIPLRSMRAPFASLRERGFCPALA